MGKNIGRSIARAFKKAPAVMKKISNGVQKYAPIADKVGKGMVMAGTVTGQPEIAALGAGVSAGANAATQVNDAVRPIMFR